MLEIKLSVVVVTHHRPKLLEKCLDALEQQTLDRSKFEVIVVDNNSTDKTANLIYKYLHRNTHFMYYRETNSGFNYARNRGIKLARASYIAFISDEVLLDNDWCKKVVDSFDTMNPSPAVLTGEIQTWFDEEIPYWFVQDLEERKMSTELRTYPKNNEILKQIDIHVAINLPVFEQLSGQKLSFHINQKYTDKIDYRSKISEDPLFVNEQLLDTHDICYNPQLLAYQYCKPQSFTFKRRRQHSFYQGFVSSQQVTFSSFLTHFLHVIVLSPVILMSYLIHWTLPQNEKIMNLIQKFSKELGFLRKTFSRNKEVTE